MRVHGKVNVEKFPQLEKGIIIDKIRYRSVKARLEKQMTSNAWIKIKLIEGKNREIRKICSYFGWRVNKLIRVSYGRFNVGNLKPGQLKEITDHPYSNENYWG